MKHFSFLVLFTACGQNLDAQGDALTTATSEDAALSDSAAAPACTTTLWAALDGTQRAAILAGQQVRVDDPDPSYWQATFYQWIPHDAPLSHPLGDAAVFWDLEGQLSYQAAYGLVDFDIEEGRGTAAVRATVTAALQTPAGTVQVPYPQENAVFRLCAGAYSISWHSANPAQPPVPGIPFVAGDITFQRFPGDGGGALMKYRINAAPSAALVNDTALRNGLLAQMSAVANAHAVRMAQGASVAQIAALLLALD